MVLQAKSAVRQSRTKATSSSLAGGRLSQTGNSDPMEPLTIPVLYDFASSLCYIAHRALGRLAPDLAEIGCRLAWTPVDLARLVGWQRGAPVAAERLANVERVSLELSVPVRTPAIWLDSRYPMAAGLALANDEREATWRERVWTAIFEEGRSAVAAAETTLLARELGLELSANDLAAGLVELEVRTRAASEAMVTGVPTFMLDDWPLAGIQTDRTMRSILRRFVDKKQRARELH